MNFYTVLGKRHMHKGTSFFAYGNCLTMDKVASASVLAKEKKKKEENAWDWGKERGKIFFVLFPFLVHKTNFDEIPLLKNAF